MSQKTWRRTRVGAAARIAGVNGTTSGCDTVPPVDKPLRVALSERDHAGPAVPLTNVKFARGARYSPEAHHASPGLPSLIPLTHPARTQLPNQFVAVSSSRPASASRAQTAPKVSPR